MDEALRLAESGSPEGTLVTAEAQTKGRGRLGRAWVSPVGNGMYFSLLLRPAWPATVTPLLTLLSAVALAETLQDAAGIDCRIKWPNDILVNGRKLAGILLESRVAKECVEFVILGIGLNIAPLSGELSSTAIGLSEVAVGNCGRSVLLQAFLRVFERRYFSVSDCGWSVVLREWERRSAVAGCRVSFDSGGKRLTATALGLADDGGLMLALDDGRVIKRVAGEIYL
jgi:BirA family biotin operon repressor/biotin-[acetyl-CoA-carboxylase] ligase